ncbi:MAG: hypothetical protein S4CHLAM20_14990 [Chlamydiia bacterium]|nr:hypothetical protein [Chlamydiia bacterium]
MANSSINHTNILSTYLWGQVGNFLDYPSFYSLSSTDTAFKAREVELSESESWIPNKINEIYKVYSTYVKVLFTTLKQDPNDTLSYLKDLLNKVTLGVVYNQAIQKVLTLFKYRLIIVLSQTIPDKYKDLKVAHTPLFLKKLFEEPSKINQQVSETENSFFPMGEEEPNKALCIILQKIATKKPPYTNPSFTNSNAVAMKVAQSLTDMQYSNFKSQCILKIIDSGRLKMAGLLIRSIHNLDKNKIILTEKLVIAYANNQDYENAFNTIEANTYLDGPSNRYISLHYTVFRIMLSKGSFERCIHEAFDLIAYLKEKHVVMSKFTFKSPYILLEETLNSFSSQKAIELAISTADRSNLAGFSEDATKRLINILFFSKKITLKAIEKIKNALINLCKNNSSFKISSLYILALLSHDKLDVVNELIDTVSPTRIKDLRILKQTLTVNFATPTEEELPFTQNLRKVIMRVTTNQEVLEDEEKSQAES